MLVAAAMAGMVVLTVYRVTVDAYGEYAASGLWAGS
jgi:hypothetical protein